MSILDWVIVALVTAMVVAAIIIWKKSGSCSCGTGGCSGNCSSCRACLSGKGCSCKK